MNTTNDFRRSTLVDDIVKEITRLVCVCRIYLYNQRIGSGGDTTSFKLCIIAPVTDKSKAERDIYLHTDCDVPFDILFYTPEEWDSLIQNPDSFANRILRNGLVVWNG